VALKLEITIFLVMSIWEVPIKVPYKHTGNFHIDNGHNRIPGAISSSSNSSSNVDVDDDDDNNNNNNNTVYTLEPATNQSPPCKKF
jgi:hypothetical protein